MNFKIKQLIATPWIKYSLQVILFLLIIYAIQLYKQRNVTQGMAPEFDEVLLSGKQIKLSDYRGKVVLLHFWATWCPVCDLEQNSIEAISKDNEIISVVMNSGEAAQIQAFMDKNKLSFPVIIDEDGILAQRYGVNGVPASFIINAQGNIEYIEIGYTTNWGLRSRLWLAEN